MAWHGIVFITCSLVFPWYLLLCCSSLGARKQASKLVDRLVDRQPARTGLDRRVQSGAKGTRQDRKEMDGKVDNKPWTPLDERGI